VGKRERRAVTPRAATEGSKQDINDPELLATQAREAIEKSAADLRKQRVPIAMEPPTVYRP
jgi:hypothetical protein